MRCLSHDKELGEDNGHKKSIHSSVNKVAFVFIDSLIFWLFPLYKELFLVLGFLPTLALRRIWIFSYQMCRYYC